MVLRSIARVPMSLFDEYRALTFRYPKMMNFYMMYMCFFVVLYAGKGIEKLSMRGEQTSYEMRRRARRLFMPYWLVGYQWGFPENTK